MRHLKPSQRLFHFCLRMGWTSSKLFHARRLKNLSLRLAAQMAVALKVSLPLFLAEMAREQGIPRRAPIRASSYFHTKPELKKKRDAAKAVKASRRKKRSPTKGKPIVVRCTVCRSEKHNRMACPYREDVTQEMMLAKARAEAMHGGQR